MKFSIMATIGSSTTFIGTDDRKVARAAAMFGDASQGLVTIEVNRTVAKTVKFRGVGDNKPVTPAPVPAPVIKLQVPVKK